MSQLQARFQHTKDLETQVTTLTAQVKDLQAKLAAHPDNSDAVTRVHQLETYMREVGNQLLQVAGPAAK
ncbi:MAG: hypothetical protein KGJ13_08045 [Patescibacteria group bacterium]|nr:hypothetical protein [Patescibacteria group bacterium]